MLYLFHGNDNEKLRKAAANVIGSAECIKLDDETFTSVRMEELIASRGLFEDKLIITLNNISQNPDALDFLKKNAKKIALSPNIFVFLENTPPVPFLKLLEKHAQKTFKYNAPILKESKFSIFSLADAFGARDKKKSWILLQKAYAAEIPPEQIHGMLFWQIKTIYSVKQSAQLQLKPFVLNKARAFGKKYTLDELSGIMARLLDAYHAREHGGPELDISLEKLILTI